MIKPEYISNNGKIRFYNCDCESLLNTGNKWDLCICDSPYGIGEDGSKNKSRGKLAASKKYKPYDGNDADSPPKHVFDNIIQNSSNQIIWGANHFISKIPYDSPCWIVWDKDNGDTDFADCELAWTSFKTSVRKFKWRWSGMLQQNMKQKQDRIHPNEKPIELYRWILMNYAKEGHKIIDPYGGSMSSAIACHMEGFELDICEKDRHYFEKAIDRFKYYERQQKLF